MIDAGHIPQGVNQVSDHRCSASDSREQSASLKTHPCLPAPGGAPTMTFLHGSCRKLSG